MSDASHITCTQPIGIWVALTMDLWKLDWEAFIESYLQTVTDSPADSVRKYINMRVIVQTMQLQMKTCHNT